MKKIQIKSISVPIETSVDELKKISAKKAGISQKDILGFKIARRSVDARRNNVSFNYSVILEIPKKQSSTFSFYLIHSNRFLFYLCVLMLFQCSHTASWWAGAVYFQFFFVQYFPHHILSPTTTQRLFD